MAAASPLHEFENIFGVPLGVSEQGAAVLRGPGDSSAVPATDGAGVAVLPAGSITADHLPYTAVASSMPIIDMEWCSDARAFAAHPDSPVCPGRWLVRVGSGPRGLVPIYHSREVFSSAEYLRRAGVVTNCAVWVCIRRPADSAGPVDVLPNVECNERASPLPLRLLTSSARWGLWSPELHTLIFQPSSSGLQQEEEEGASDSDSDSDKDPDENAPVDTLTMGGWKHSQRSCPLPPQCVPVRLPAGSQTVWFAQACGVLWFAQA